MALLLTLSIILVGFVSLYFYLRSKLNFWTDNGFIQEEPDLLWGNMKGVGTKITFSKLFEDVYKKYKDIAPAVGIYFFHLPMLVLWDLDTIKDVLIKNFNNFHGRGIYHNAKADPLSAHLFALDGNEWKTIRNKISPTFTSGKIKLMFNIVWETSHEMVKYVRKESDKQSDLEMKEILARFTTDVIGSIAFGLDLNSMENPNSKFREIGKKAVTIKGIGQLKVFFVSIFQGFAKKMNMKLIDPEVSEFFINSMKETIDYREQNNIRRNDFLDLLIQLKNHGKLHGDDETYDKLTFNEIVAECFVFFLAGERNFLFE